MRINTSLCLPLLVPRPRGLAPRSFAWPCLLALLLSAWLSGGALEAVGADNSPSEPRLTARGFNSGFPEAHDTYNGLSCASDGRIYYVLSSESIDVAAQMFVFDPATDQIQHLGDLTEACGEKGLKAIPQGKSHVNFVEADGKLYFATHIGYYSIIDGMEKIGIPPAGYKPYPGGHLLAYDMKSGRFEDLALAPDREGILTMNMDTPRGRIFGLTWPSGQFFRFDLSSKDLKNFGKVCAEGEDGKGPTYRTVCRSIAVDLEDGSAYFTTSEGTILRYDPGRDQLVTVLGEDMRKDYFGIYDPTSPGHMGYNWRQTFWHPGDKMIYGVHGNSGYLFRFDPRQPRLEVLERLTSLPSKRSGMFDQFSYGYLGFGLGPDQRTIFYLTGGPIYIDGKRLAGKGTTAMGEAKGLENLHLVTFDLTTGRYADHGAIFFQDGRRPLYVNSLAIGKDQSVYTLSRITEKGKTRTDLLQVKTPLQQSQAGTKSSSMEVGLATRDVTPQDPVWLAGYAARTKPHERADTPLLLQACAFRSGSERLVMIALDNCEVSREFMAPILSSIEKQHGLPSGAVMVVSSHTHAAPVIEGPLHNMYPLDNAQKAAVQEYGNRLKSALVDAVTAALQDLKPVTLEQGTGRATFAMNRRAFREDAVYIGENPIAPVDWDVPVLKITSADGKVRAVLFGYACHATTIAGEDFYVASGDFIAYARQHLESLFPGTVFMFLTGMGADANPSPRGSLNLSRRHGLELAGAVCGVLGRPMRSVQGPLKLAYADLPLPLVTPPTRTQLEQDARHQDVHIRNRANKYLGLLEKGEPLPESVPLPIAAVTIGDDLAFLAMGGEVVVDYALRLKHQYQQHHPWTIGYAYDVPCYIPTIRLLREGGYEADSSMIYYGLYGPFQPSVEKRIYAKMAELMKEAQAR